MGKVICIYPYIPKVLEVTLRPRATALNGADDIICRGFNVSIFTINFSFSMRSHLCTFVAVRVSCTKKGNLFKRKGTQMMRNQGGG